MNSQKTLLNRDRFQRKLMITALAMLILPLIAAAGIIHVDATDGDDGHGGTNWADAFATIEAAIDVAVDGDELWIKAGTYHPPVSGSVNRWIFYQVEESIAIYGGFAGTETTEAERDARDYQANETIIDCNRNHYYGQVNSPFGTHGFRLGTTSGDTDIRLDGLTITNGYAYHHTNHVYSRGGGVLVTNGNVVIANCNIHHNTANPTPAEWGGMGGGVQVLMGGSAGSAKCMIINSTIADNTSRYGGGGIDAFSSSTQIVDYLHVVNCKMYRNNASSTAAGIGGGLRSHLGHTGTLINNTEFWGNQAGYGGGAVSIDGGTVSNCTFFYNRTGNSDPANYPAGGLRNVNRAAVIHNSIFWANESGLAGHEQLSAHATITANDSVVQDGWATGANIIDQDPIFVDPDHYDANLRLQPMSPCIDAGDNESIESDFGDLDRDGDDEEQTPFDLDGRARIIDGDNDTTATVDMGAYEYEVDPNAVTYSVTVNVVGAVGQVTGPGVDCPGNCGGFYYEGTELRLIAISSPNALFDHWEGVDWTPEWNEGVIWLNEDRTITAVFTTPPNEPRLEVTPGELDFWEIEVGGYTTERLYLKNVGGQPLEIGTIEEPPFPFSLYEEPCSNVTLATGEVCEMRLRFEPNDEVDYQEALVIPSNDPVGDTIVPLIGLGYRDSDNDRVSDREEKGPNGDDEEYDGNGDGQPDWLQRNVVSLHSEDMEKYLNIAVPEQEAYFDRVRVSDSDKWPDDDDDSTPLPDGVYPLYGMFELSIRLQDGATATNATMKLPTGARPFSFYQMGPTPADPNDHGFYEFIHDGQTGATINNYVVVIDYTDAARGDERLEEPDDYIEATCGPIWTTPDGADDDDGDGVPTAIDNCPFTWNPSQHDSDGDGFGNLCDDCPDDPGKRVPGECGCGVSDVDSDGDGTPDCYDDCPDDPDKVEPGLCGCGVADIDSDGDGYLDCDDLCDDDPDKAEPGDCGCGTPDTDSDDDGIADCLDNCPDTPNPDQADTDNDGIGDACTPAGDNDGVSDDEEDGAPNGGDGNNDGILDGDQDNVASFVGTNGDYVTLAVPEGIELVDVAAIDNPSPDDVPGDAQFPAGFLTFEIHGLEVGGAVDLEIILDLPDGVVVDSYWKYGPTPDNTEPHWYAFMYDGTTGAEINGNVITLHLVDGQRGDSDLTADGIITDPGAPAFDPFGAAAQDIPEFLPLCGGNACGSGVLGYLPLSLVGLAGLKARRRRGV